MTNKWVVYIVLCSKNNSLYTGITNDLVNRIKSHNNGTGAKYTRSFGPVSLVYYESAMDRSSASKREYQIKQLNKSDKISLIKSANNLLQIKIPL